MSGKSSEVIDELNLFTNPFSIEGKTILITGASSGIGRATAVMCSQMGAHVCITGRSEEKLNDTMSRLEGDNHAMICADLNEHSEIEKLITWSPQLDGLVLNAGTLELLPADFITQEKMNHTLSVNTFAPILIFSGLARKRKLKKFSSVVFTSSLAGNYVTAYGHSVYSVSKAALSAFAKNAALEMAARKIRVNCICPGMIETDLIHNERVTQEMLAEDAKRYPLKRYGRPEEAANGIIFLLSDASSFITGINLVIDGGMTLL